MSAAALKQIENRTALVGMRFPVSSNEQTYSCTDAWHVMANSEFV